MSNLCVAKGMHENNLLTTPWCSFAHVLMDFWGKQATHHSMVLIPSNLQRISEKENGSPFDGAHILLLPHAYLCVLLTVSKRHSCDTAPKHAAAKVWRRFANQMQETHFKVGDGISWHHPEMQFASKCTEGLYTISILHTPPRTLEYFGCKSFSTARLAGFH